MRKPLNHIAGQAVEGKWKEELIIELSKLNDIKTFIETGTANASTVLAVCKSFDKCHTIELSKTYFEAAQDFVKNFFRGEGNIQLHYGNSGEILADVIKKAGKEPKLFWLDAHPCGGDSANEGDPLPNELNAIVTLAPDSLILIDDEPNEQITRVTDAGVDLSGWTREYHYGIIFLHKGQFKIPEFV